MEAIVYFIFIHASLLVLGYSLLAKFGVFKSQPGIQLSVSYLASITFLGILAFAYYVFQIPVLAIQLIFWGSLALAITIIIWGKLYRELIQHWFILSAAILMSALSLCITSFSLPASSQQIVPDPEPRQDRNYTTLSTKILTLAQTQANDNYIPYRQAQFFVNRSDPAKDSFINEWGVHFFQRTPLMGSVAAGYFLVLNDKPPVDYTWSLTGADPDNTYIKFQIIAQILNSLLIIPAYFLLRKLFNKKAAVISVLFLIPSQFFIYNAFFSWPKSLVAFFILVSWLLLLSDRRLQYTAVAAVASGLAYLTHDLAVLYIGATVIFLLFTRRFIDSVIIAAGSALFALPWLFTAGVLYHKLSSFIYYPISIKDIPQPAQYEEVVRTFFSTSPLTIIGIRLESLFYLLSPYQLIVAEEGQTVSTRLWALGIYSIPGAVGIGLFVPLIIGIYKYFSNIKLWILWLVPVILSVIVIGWPHGLGALHFAEATVVLLTGLATVWLARSRYAKWLYLAFALNIAQLIYFIAYTYGFGFSIHGLKELLSVVVIATIVILCAVGLYYTLSGKSKKFLNLVSDK